MKKIDHLDCYRVILCIVRTGSARAAGEELGMEPTNVFRVLRSVEEELGSPLFDRDRRPMKLTPKGEVFCELAQRMLGLQNQLLTAFSDDVDKDEGLIRIASTAGARHNIITPAIVQYQAEHPLVQFEMQDMIDGNQNFMQTLKGLNNDIVLRYFTDDPSPEGTIVRDIATISFHSCASPYYVQRRGAPTHPAACRDHSGILLQLPGRRSVEHLQHDGRSERLEWAQVTRFNSQVDARDALVMGMGIVPDLALPYFYEVAKSGRAVPVMLGWSRPKARVCLYISAEAAKKRRVQLFVDWFAARYTKDLIAMQKWVDAYLAEEMKKRVPEA